MNSLYTFLIQSSIALVLFYLVYWLLLRKETYYNANRFFLLLAILLSGLLPLFPLHYNVFVDAGMQKASLFTEMGNAFKEIKPFEGEGLNQSFSLSLAESLLIVYFTGAFIFLLRLVIQTGVLIQLLFKNKIKTVEGFHIVESEKYGLPFSFFNIIYINPKFHNQDVLPEILAHEKVHIREKHWVDLLIIELLTVIFWFNPFIWFFEHSIKLNHEFLADHGVISKGTHIGKYQALLVNQLMGMQIIGITNNLNFSINSNRLKMMTKQKTPKIKTIKMVWAMPVLALLLFAFAEPNYQQMQGKQTENSLADISGQKVTKISGTVNDEKGNPLPGVSIIVKGTSTGTVSDLKGEFQIALADNSDLVFSYVGKETLIFKASELLPTAGKGIKIAMKDAAIYLDPDKFFVGETSAPPPQNVKNLPPPPPPKSANTKNLPPPPPPKKGAKETQEFIVVEQMPEYPGGYPALGDYINKMQQKLAQAKSIKGKAKVSFVIDKNGKAKDIRILETDNDMAGKGAATIVMNMEKWIPGMQRGKAVEVNYILPIEF